MANGYKRFSIYAKRRKDEKWSPWTICDKYEDAKEQAMKARSAGYLSKIVDGKGNGQKRIS